VLEKEPVVRRARLPYTPMKQKQKRTQGLGYAAQR